MLFERWVEDARHVEVQVFGDHHGQVIDLFDRDCSTQRRHQKVMEEAPAPGLRLAGDARGRGRGGEGHRLRRRRDGRVHLATRNAGEFFFLEMNTRLQVEHPVTEAVTGLDLVELQLAVAAGRRLDDLVELTRPQGHAIEFRLYAEDPAAGFLPATGRLDELELPGRPARNPRRHGRTGGRLRQPLLRPDDREDSRSWAQSCAGAGSHARRPWSDASGA